MPFSCTLCTWVLGVPLVLLTCTTSRMQQMLSQSSNFEFLDPCVRSSLARVARRTERNPAILRHTHLPVYIFRALVPQQSADNKIMRWSIEEYCANNAVAADAADAATTLHYSESSREFLGLLDLPTRHPFCENNNDVASFFDVPGIPPMGPLDHRLEDESLWEKVITLWLMVAPPLLAMAELWLRLVAGIVGPVGCVLLLHTLLQTTGTRRGFWYLEEEKNHQQRNRLGIICTLTVASSLVLMTDTYYVLNNGGPLIGVFMFLGSLILAVQVCYQYQLNTAAVTIWFLVLLAIHLVWDVPSSEEGGGRLKFGHPEEQVTISEGLYYDSSNPFIQSIVDHWPETYRTYSIANGATPWMPSGDSRTGLPFLINHWPAPNWHRVFLPAIDEEEDDDEYVALDIAFPSEGFQKSKPLYLVLHGLNGGSNEEYIRDFTYRRLQEGSTVVVMIARGLMDLPIRG